MFNKHNETKQRFTIKKYSFGVASALIGVFFAAGANSAQAEEVKVAEKPLVNTVAQAPEAPAATEAPVAAVTEKGTAVTTPAKENLPLSSFRPKSSATKRPANEGQKIAEGTGFRGTATGTKVAVDGGKTLASATLTAEAGSAQINYALDIKPGYKAGDTLVLEFEENVTEIPGDILQKELATKDGKVIAKLQEPVETLYKNKDGVGSYWSQRSDSQTMDQKKANDIQNRGTLLKYTYVFTDAVADMSGFQLNQSFKTPTQYPRIEKDKEVTSVFRVNGTVVAETTYTQKGQPLAPYQAGKFDARSDGEIKLNASNEFVSKNEGIVLTDRDSSFKTGTTFTYKLNNTDMNRFRKTGDLPVAAAQAMGGGDLGTAEVNEHGVVLFGQRVAPKFQVTNVTDDTLTFKLVEGQMLQGYTYKLWLKNFGVERTLENNAFNYINDKKTEIRSPQDGAISITGPDGAVIADNIKIEAPVYWTLVGPNLSNMDGNFIEKHKALGSLALRYLDAETGASLLPSKSLINNEVITDLSKRKYKANTPAEDKVNSATAKDDKTLVENKEEAGVKTTHVTPPYMITDKEGNIYFFKEYTTSDKNPVVDPDAENQDAKEYYPDAFIDGDLRDANKLESGVQNILATYEKQKMGKVVVRYLKDNTKVILQPETPTKYDGTPKFENIVGEAYDVTDIVAPKEITDENGLVYELNEKELPANIKGNLTEKTVEVDYRYVPKAGKLVKIKYENEDGVEIGKDINLENRFANEKLAGGVPNLHVGSEYDGTSKDYIEPKIVEGDITYVPREVDVHKSGSAPLVGKVTADEQTIVFVYIPLQKAEVKYLLDTTKAEIDPKLYPAEKAEGLRGEAIQLSTKETIAKLESKGYELVTDGFKADTKYDNDNKITQTFEVVLKERIVEVPADAKPGQPVDPKNPDGPKWPDTIANLENKEEVNQEVDYLFAADKKEAHADATDKVTFSRKSSVNLVTGKLSYGEWTADNADTTFDAKKSPVVTGFLADKVQVDEKTGIKADALDADYKEPVLYSPIGAYVVTDPNGKVTNTPYPNHPTDPTKPGVPTNVIPFIPGYTPVNPDGTPLTPVDPKDPSKGFLPPAIPAEYGKDTPISYTKHELVTVVFEDNKGKEVAPKISKEGFPGTDVPSEDVTKTITELRAKGYTVVSNNYPEAAKFDTDPKTPQDYKVVVEEPVVPFDSENPPKEGTPIDPTNPNGPKWTPELIKAVTETATTERVTRTVKYVKEDGTEAAKPVSETLVFKRETKINVVTKEITTGKWTAEDTKFDEVKSPLVTGYLADKALVPAKDGVLATDADSEEIVKYKVIGAYVVTDPNGNVVNTPYPNHPTDPTKPGVPTNVIPFVPGYTPVNPDGTPLTPVDPKDPSKGFLPPAIPADFGKNTPITYTKHEIVTLTFKDKGGKEVAPTVTLDGFPGTKVPYSPDQTINELKAKGYRIVENTYPTDLSFDKDPNTPQDYKVVVEEPLVEVDPKNPPKEGTPIDPTNPNGPKWTPELLELVKNAKVDEKVTRTINYVKADGSEAAPSAVESVEFKRGASINVVTKELVLSAWTPTTDTTLEGRKSPVIAGYVADKEVVADIKDVKAEDADITEIVTYRLNPAPVVAPKADRPAPAKGSAKGAVAPAKASSSAKAGVLPKTSAAKGTETNTALPAGLAAALVAAGLLTASRRKER